MSQGVALNVLFERHRLPEKYRIFVAAVLDGARPADASGMAGFARHGWPQVMSIPAVSAALHEAIQQSLQADASVNLKVLREIRDDKDAPKGVRSEIALKLMKLAGHVEPTKRDDSAPEKQLSEMSQDELRDYIARNQAEIDRLEGELAARAVDVSAPSSAPDESPSGPNYLD